jgi:hypothetical protein
MKWFMAQVCAIVFCMGVQPLALFALGFDHQGTVTADQIDLIEPMSAGLPHDTIMPGPGFYALVDPSGVNGSAFDAYAAQQLFGACVQEWQGQGCSIDPGFTSVTYGSRLYPAVSRGGGNLSDIAMTRNDQASSAEPVPASLVVIGLGLVVLAFMRRRKRRASLRAGRQALPLAHSRLSPRDLDSRKEGKAPSLAA